MLYRYQASAVIILPVNIPKEFRDEGIVDEWGEEREVGPGGGINNT